MQIFYLAEKLHAMEKNVVISLYLDTRREIKNSKYPLKLRVFTSKPRRQKLYKLKYSFTEEEFAQLYSSEKLRKEKKRTKLELDAIEKEALDIADQLPQFSFEAFARKMFSINAANTNDVAEYYSRTISQFKANAQVSTAALYKLSLDSLIAYHGKGKLTFHAISPQWLRDYEQKMLKAEKSKTTISMYLRTLRTIYNQAVHDKVISAEEYPFGKRRYSIPNPKGVKKALTKEQLKSLFEKEPLTDEQRKAKDFWFFSYVCNGINFKDIANLRYRNISNDRLIFNRAKTASTNNQQAPVVVFLTDFAKEVIKRHGDPNKKADNYIFTIIEPDASAEVKHRQLKNFVRYVNQHFSKYAKLVGINEQVSTYWARHSFATNAIRGGASMEYVSEALSHSNMNTTRGYFAGFDDEKKKEISEKLMDFKD